MKHFALAPVVGQPFTWGEGSFDFETYSEGGYIWDDGAGKWLKPPGASSQNKGLGIVGANAYTEHPSARVLTLTYKLPRLWFDAYGRPREGGYKARWKPGQPPPFDLFDYLAAGGIIKAFNVMFERLVWGNICVPKYGWPSLEPYRYQLRCTMATARVNSLPGKLGPLGDVLRLTTTKDKAGKALLDKFSIPRNPTKKDPRLRVMPEDDPADFAKLESYCDDDVQTEDEAAEAMEPMTGEELLFWWIDQEINYRGVAIDREGVRNCIAILDQCLIQYGEECRQISGFEPGQLAEIRGWLASRGVYLDNMKEETVTAALETWEKVYPAPPPGVTDQRRRVLEIRSLIGSASVKKLYAMENQACRDDRLRNLIVHHGARTGRPTGEGPQPLNLPRTGPDVKWCGRVKGPDGKLTWAPDAYRKPFNFALPGCPWCQRTAADVGKGKWSAEAVDVALEVIAHRSLELVEYYLGDALKVISGCLRGLFVAGPGMELIASDFSAIEAVVTAMLAKCEWRIEVFRSRRDIYLMSAAKITGKTYEWYVDYAAQNGENHADRQKIGKVAELALGFMGWIPAWRNFDKTDTFSDQEVKANILAWRDASPEIVELAGGQRRGFGKTARHEFFGFEGCAVQAIQNPGLTFECAGIRFYMRGDALKIRLLSGRELTYWNPRLTPSTRDYAGPGELSITYWTWNTNTKYGPPGWVIMSTYAGKLIENVVQAVAHDILRFAIINLRAAGYHAVLHVYDEIVVEVPKGHGSIEEVERIMGIMPWWAAGWPISANGGWRGFRYRKG